MEQKKMQEDASLKAASVTRSVIVLAVHRE